jgi:serine/threonine protein phosphatase PrpC
MNKYFAKKYNQDAYTMSLKLLDLQHFHFFAVLDGHGVVGKEIVATVEQRLKQIMEQELEETLVFAPDERLNLHKEFPATKDFKQAINNAFDKT